MDNTLKSISPAAAVDCEADVGARDGQAEDDELHEEPEPAAAAAAVCRWRLLAAVLVAVVVLLGRGRAGAGLA